MKELSKDILNNQGTYSSDIDEYSFTVNQGKSSANVILNLGLGSDETISNDKITKALVEYISVFEDITTWQLGN